MVKAPPEAKFVRIPIGDIDPGPNIRVDTAALERLVDSIRMHGVLQPITVVPTEAGDRVECLFGHRRLVASRLAGVKEMPCFARPRGSESSRILMQLAENRDRLDMTTLEEAKVIGDLKATGMTARSISDAIGMDYQAVRRRLALLDYPPIVQAQVQARRLPVDVAVSIPLELANEHANSDELAAACRRGSAAVRDWIACKVDLSAAQGRPVVAKTNEVVNLDGILMSRVRAAAKAAGETTKAWVTDALTKKLAGTETR